jgi:hypothetical protein
MFGGLQFGGVGREEVQIDVVGYTQVQTGVPSSTIQHDPARSSTIFFLGLTPTWRAKAASSASKIGMLTEVAR